MAKVELMDATGTVRDLLAVRHAPLEEGCAVDVTKVGAVFEGAVKTIAEFGSACLRTTTPFAVRDGRVTTAGVAGFEAGGLRVITPFEIPGLSVTTP